MLIVSGTDRVLSTVYSKEGLSVQLSLQSQILTETEIGPSGSSFVFRLTSIGSLFKFPNISLNGISIFRSLTLTSTPQIPSGSLASMLRVTFSLHVAPSWGKVITQ